MPVALAPSALTPLPHQNNPQPAATSEDVHALLSAPKRRAHPNEVASVDLSFYQAEFKARQSSPRCALIIDAPETSHVFINGKWQGCGQIILDNVTPGDEVDVRISLSGFLPWIGSVIIHVASATRLQPRLQKHLS